MSSQSAGRQRLNMEEYSAEEEALSILSEAADIRLAAKKAIKAEAKEIRLKELEKQQKESDSEQGNVCNDSTHACDTTETQLRELEIKYKSAMVHSAQVDNDNQSLVYQVELLKDQIEEREEEHAELQRNYKEKCVQYNFQNRDLQNMVKELSILKQQLEITRALLAESGFIILVNDRGEPVLEKSSQINVNTSHGVIPFIAPAESQNLLKKADETKLRNGVADAKKSAHCNQVSESSDEVDGSKVVQVSLSDYSKDNSDGGGISSDNKPLDSESGIVSQLQKTETSSLCVDYSGTERAPHSTSANVELEPDGVSVDDDADEFYDAVSTPSPSTKTNTYEEQNQIVIANENEGSSVDPEIRIKGYEEACIPNNIDSERQSILLENVTETESSTDIVDESDEHDIKESIADAEYSKETADQNTVLDVDSVKDAIEDKINQKLISEISGDDLIEIKNVSGEASNIAEDLGVEELNAENKAVKENSFENGTTDEILEQINNDSQDVVCDIPDDVTPSDTAVSQQEEVEDVQNISEIIEHPSCELQSKTSLTDFGVEANDVCLSEETLQVYADKRNRINDATEEKGETVSVETSDILRAEDTSDTPDARDIQDAVDKAGTSDVGNIQDVIEEDNQDVSSLTSPEIKDVPCVPKITLEDAAEEEDNENMAENVEGDAEQLSQDNLSAGTENKKESEVNVIFGGKVTEDSKTETNVEEDDSSEPVINDNIEENEHKEEPGFPVNDAPKLIVRTTSIGGSEASEGAVIDDYDFDDIDDVLNTDALSSSGVDLNTTPNSECEASVVTALEILDDDNESSAKSPSADVGKGEGIKTKGSKKDKGDKSKHGKKSNTDKTEKIKSGDKESKDKVEKTKNKESKEKPDKKKSSKKDSSHEKKVEKSRNKKETTPDGKSEAVSGSEEDKHSIAESQASLEPDDLEGALDKQMLESEKLKSPKKSSKKLSIFKKVFK